ncbi:MAG: carboxypeptidase regulatory-like domain-containing protein [Rhodospirillaceae bacterium]|nr:carboxypeptidase regulatory-like domain-containing protein [Rhodospirillaceae bacterium]
MRAPLSLAVRSVVPLLAAVLVVLASQGAHAHRLNLFAFVDGQSIQGSAYYSGGGAPGGAEIVAYGPDGAEIGHATTDADGNFSFTPTQPVDHRITIATADGHAAEFVVTAAELPAPLAAPAAEPQAPVAADEAEAGEAPPAAESEAVADRPTDVPAVAAAPAIDPAELESLIGRTVQRQIQPLRQQLFAYEGAIHMHDVLGGIGYILGLFGIAAYLMSLRRRKVAG